MEKGYYMFSASISRVILLSSQSTIKMEKGYYKEDVSKKKSLGGSRNPQ